MKGAGVIALVATAAALSACGSPAAPVPSFKAGLYSVVFKSGDVLTGAPPCSGLPAPASYSANIRFEADGAGFRGRGADFNANATVDIRIQVDGESIQGTITGSLRDDSISIPLPGPATLTFVPNADGSSARFVGSYSRLGLPSLGSIDGKPTIAIPASTPLTGSCAVNQLKWILTFLS